MNDNPSPTVKKIDDPRKSVKKRLTRCNVMPVDLGHIAVRPIAENVITYLTLALTLTLMLPDGDRDRGRY